MENQIKYIINLTKRIIKAIIISFYTTFVIALISGGISAGIMTLLPDNASKPCYLGYYAHCSFTPYSTLILFLMAIVGIILIIPLAKYFRRKIKQQSNKT